MAAALPNIGATAVLGGLSAFNAGLQAIGTQFARVGAAVGVVEEPLKGATAGFKEFNDAIKPVAASLALVDAAFKTVGTAVSAATAPIRAALGALRELMEEVGSRSVQALTGIVTAATALGTGGVVGLTAFGAAITTAFGASLAAAARFQREVIDVAAITQEAPAAVAGLTEAVKGLAREFATSIPDIQAAGLELARAGVPMEAITSTGLKLTLALEQLSKGELTAGAGAEALGSLFQVFRRNFEEAGTTIPEGLTRIANAITAIGNETRATIPEVVSAFNKMGVAFANTNQPVEDAAAAVGLLLAQGLRGEEAGTALANFFLRLQAPASEAHKIMERFGVTTIDATTGAMLPFGVILQDLIDKFGPYQRSIRAITEEEANWAQGEIFQTRVLRGVQLATLAGTDAYERLREAIRQTDIFAQAAQQMDALLRQLSRFRNIVELASVAFGTEFVEGLSAATRSVNDFLVAGTRLERLATSIGAGIRGVVTGAGAATGAGGGEQSRESFEVASTFGQEAAASLATFTEQARRGLAAVGELVGALVRLKDTLVGVAFPLGIDDLVVRTTNTFIRATQGVQAFVEFLGRIAPIAANAFGNAVQGVLAFLRALRDTITVGLSADDVADIFADLGTAARNIGSVIASLVLAVGQFVRTVIDNRDALIGTFVFVAQAIGKITEVVIGAARAVITLIGLIARIPKAVPIVAAAAAGTAVGGPVVGAGAAQAASAIGLLGGGAAEKLDADVAVLDQLAAATGELGRALAQGQTTAEGFTAAIGDGSSVWERAVETFRTGKSELQRQAESLDKLREAATRGAPLGEFLGDPLIPQNIKDSIAEIVEILSTTDERLGGMERLRELFGDIEHEAAGAREEVRKALAISGGDGSAGRPLFPFSDSQRAQETAAKELARAQDRISEAREDALKNISAAERQLANASAGIIQRYADTLESINQQHQDALKNINDQEFETLERLRREFTKTQTRAGEDIARGRSDEDARRLHDQGIEDTRIIRENAAADAELIEQRRAQRVEQIERRHQEDLTRIRQQGIDNANTQFARGQEDALRALTRANEQAVEALTAQFEGQNLGRGRGREDDRRIRDRDRALAKAETAEQRQEILTRFGEESELLKERRKEEDEERQIRKQQESALQALRQQQEVQVLAFRRAQEDAATNRRREQEVDDIAFRRSLEEQFQAFKEGLDAEALARRRTAERQALAERRADEAQGVAEGRRQQDALRAEVTLPRAREDLGEQVAETERRAEERRLEARDAAARRLAAAERTTNRELESAVRTFLERLTSINERIEDQRTDAIRGTREQAEELARLIAIAPENEQVKLQEVLDRVNGLGGSYRGLKAEIEAAGLVEAGFAQARIEEIRTRLGLRAEETRSIEELREEFRLLQAGGGEGGTREIEIRAFISSPQVDLVVDLLRAIERNTGGTLGGGRGTVGAPAGPVIGTVTIEAPDAVEGVQELGRIFSQVGGNA